jgi:hypothetical protein
MSGLLGINKTQYNNLPGNNRTPLLLSNPVTAYAPQPTAAPFVEGSFTGMNKNALEQITGINENALRNANARNANTNGLKSGKPRYKYNTRNGVVPRPNGVVRINASSRNYPFYSNFQIGSTKKRIRGIKPENILLGYKQQLNLNNNTLLKQAEQKKLEEDALRSMRNSTYKNYENLKGQQRRAQELQRQAAEAARIARNSKHTAKSQFRSINTALQPKKPWYKFWGGKSRKTRRNSRR